MTSVPGQGSDNVTERAIEAAAEAMEDSAMRWLGRDLGTIHRNDIAADALVAAVPILLADLEQRIDEAAVADRRIRADDACDDECDGLDWECHASGAWSGFDDAKRVVRSAAARWIK